LRLQSHSEGSKIDSPKSAKIIHEVVPPNWEIPKKVATVFGNDVIVVIIVR
jgi:hypothetical protein